MTDLLRLEFLGGPMDGAIRPVPVDCNRMPLAAGAVIHVYLRDEVLDGNAVRPVMRHHQIVQAWVNQ